MKIFAISLARATERRTYITQHLESLRVDYEIVEAIDGKFFTEDKLNIHCNQEQRKKLPHWLTQSSIACALSHRLAYEKLINSTSSMALMIEDDVILPTNIESILNELAQTTKDCEIVLLYATSFRKCKLVPTEIKNIYIPENIKEPISAAAYFLTRNTAEKLYKNMYPIYVTADCWHHYIHSKWIDKIKLAYPFPVKTKNFKSSIDYLKSDTLLAKILNFINKYKIPPIYQILYLKRLRHLKQMEGRFYL
ncbi:MAG: glycosyltransferase family 25 protein [Cytophagales bacterium]